MLLSFSVECVCIIQQTYLLAMHCASQPSHEESQLHLSAAQYVTKDYYYYYYYHMFPVNSVNDILQHRTHVLSKMNVCIQGRNYFHTRRLLPFSSMTRRNPNAKKHIFTQRVR